MARLGSALAAMGAARPTTVSEDTEDVALLQRIARGDRGALETLYTRYQRPLFQYLASLAPERETAEELLQDTFVAVWRSAASFGGRARVKTWLLALARRQAHNTLRRATLPLTTLAALDDAPSPDATPEHAVLQQADREALASAFAQLAPRHREALLLVFQHGLSYQELADVLAIPLGTVRSRLSNAKLALKTCLAHPSPPRP